MLVVVGMLLCNSIMQPANNIHQSQHPRCIAYSLYLSTKNGLDSAVMVIFVHMNIMAVSIEWALNAAIV